MSIENNFNQETKEITQEQVIEKIIADPEDRELLGQFIDQLQAKVEEGETSDLDFNIELAGLYEEIAQDVPAWAEFAGQSYYDAATIANQEGNKALYEELLAKSRKFSF